LEEYAPLSFSLNRVYKTEFSIYNPPSFKPKKRDFVMNKPTGQALTKLGFSKLFTCDLVDAWARVFGDRSVTIDELLGDGATSYLILRAAGVTAPMFGRSRQEVRRVSCWLIHFSNNPLPTHDGFDDAVLIANGDSWSLRIRQTVAA
jgi:hypothetical protein